MPTLLSLRQSWPSRIYWHGAPISWRGIIAAVLTLTALYLFYHALNEYAVNIPVTDDYQATLSFLYNYETYPANRFALLVGQHNEHRIVASRLLALWQYSLTGEVNFRQLLLWQSLFLPALLAAVGGLFHQCGVRLNSVRRLPLVLLLFSLNTWETYLFVSGSAQSYPALLSMTLTLICLHRSMQGVELTRLAWLFGGAFWAVVATFSFGCGALVWAGGLLLLGLRGHWQASAIWLLLMLLALLGYLHDYRPTSLSQHPLVSLRDHIGVFVRFAISFPGTSFQIPWSDPALWRINLIACYAIGLLSWGYFGYLTVTGYARQQPLVYTFMALFFAVDVLIAFSRCRMGVNTAFNSRYQILSAMLTMGLYLALWQRTKLRVYSVARLSSYTLLLVFALSAFYQPHLLAMQHAQKVNGLKQWMQQGSPTLFTLPQYQRESGLILKKCRARIYKPEPDLFGIANPTRSLHQYTSPFAPARLISKH